MKARFGYKQVLHRTWGQFEAFMASFGALYVVGGVRILYSVGINSGGPAALWSSMLITIVFMLITAASLAEICSSIPLSGSIYIWAAEAAGPKHGVSTLSSRRSDAHACPRSILGVRRRVLGDDRMDVVRC